MKCFAVELVILAALVHAQDDRREITTDNSSYKEWGDISTDGTVWWKHIFHWFLSEDDEDDSNSENDSSSVFDSSTNDQPWSMHIALSNEVPIVEMAKSNATTKLPEIKATAVTADKPKSKGKTLQITSVKLVNGGGNNNNNNSSISDNNDTTTTTLYTTNSSSQSFFETQLDWTATLCRNTNIASWLNRLEALTDKKTLKDPKTPQALALEWLQNVDPMALDVCDESNNDLEQRYALLTLYATTNGLEWSRDTSWWSGNTECDWYGVQCNWQNKVIMVQLGSNRLKGTLPIELAALTELRVLDVYDNELSGTFPVDKLLSSWSLIEVIDIENNEFEGRLEYNNDDNNNNNTVLRSWRASRNQFSGSLPTFLAEITSLKELWLAENDFRGSIPTEWSSLTNLETVYLYNNSLTDELPLRVSSWTNLQKLRLDGNRLTGSLPEVWFDSLLNLTELNVNYNLLDGTIPTLIGQLDKLTDLRLSHNALSGNFPSHITGLTKLQYLGLSNNFLDGIVRDSFDDLTMLIYVDLSNNALSGAVPSSLFELPALEILYLDHNNFTGFVPKSVVQNPRSKLRHLFLNKNAIIGTFPAITTTEVNALGNLQSLALDDNYLHGSIPAELCALPFLDGITADCTRNGISAVECDCCLEC